MQIAGAAPTPMGSDTGDRGGSSRVGQRLAGRVAD